MCQAHVLLFMVTTIHHLLIFRKSCFSHSQLFLDPYTNTGRGSNFQGRVQSCAVRDIAACVTFYSLQNDLRARYHVSQNAHEEGLFTPIIEENRLSIKSVKVVALAGGSMEYRFHFFKPVGMYPHLRVSLLRLFWI